MLRVDTAADTAVPVDDPDSELSSRLDRLPWAHDEPIPAQEMARWLHDVLVNAQVDIAGRGEQSFSAQLPSFDCQIRSWRTAIVLTALAAKVKEDPALEPLVVSYYKLACEGFDRDKLIAAIKHITLLPQLAWGATALEALDLQDSPLRAGLEAYKCLSAELKRIETFLDRMFGKIVVATRENFDEEAYLAANPAVAAAVAQGGYTSGLEHFLGCGIREQRKLRFPAMRTYCWA